MHQDFSDKKILESLLFKEEESVMLLMLINTCSWWCYCFPIYLTEMSDTSPAASPSCGPDEVNVDGTCTSENPATVFMAYACLLVLGQTPKQSGGQGVAMWSGMHWWPLTTPLNELSMCPGVRWASSPWRQPSDRLWITPRQVLGSWQRWKGEGRFIQEMNEMSLYVIRFNNLFHT